LSCGGSIGSSSYQRRAKLIPLVTVGVLCMVNVALMRGAPEPKQGVVADLDVAKRRVTWRLCRRTLRMVRRRLQPVNRLA
jgi:hypothetical protein